MNRIALTTLSLLAVSGAAAAGDAHWGYTGHGAPERWAELSPAYALCGTGKNQSPIDLSGFIEAELEPVDIAYQPGGTEVLNNGHTIQVNYAPGSSFTIDGHRFELKQFHFHAPSENRVNGVSFPMEGHLVHADDQGNLAVISVLFQEGAANPVVAAAWEQMPEQAGGKEALPQAVDAAGLLPADRDYYRFNGSLTTPPCSEGVVWVVMKQPVTVSQEQIGKFTHAMHHPNNRPIQPVNARPVLK
ncbi:MAG TPA: carbonic anhydrase family protein [Sedimenticola sp.]|nr:carbonic anhydrase family protein [Sedimenticola sp.]